MMHKRVALLMPFYNSEPEGRYARVHDFVASAQEIGDKDVQFDIISLKSNGRQDGRNVYSANSLHKLWKYLYSTRHLYDAYHVVSYNCFQHWFPKTLIGNKTLLLGPNVLGFFPARRGSQWVLDDYARPARAKEKIKFRLKRRILTEGNLLSSRFKAVFCFGKYHRDLLFSVGANPSKVVDFVSGVRSDIFSPRGAKYRITDHLQLLYVGDLSVYKGFDLLLDSLRELRREGVKFKTVVIGNGKVDYSKIKALNLMNALDIKGFVERGQLGPFYRGSDLFIHPSEEEAHPTTMMESLACGTPVLVPKHPAFEELCNNTSEGANAIFFEDRSSLSNVLMKHLNDVGRLREHALHSSSKYFMGNGTHEFLMKYRGLLN